MKLKAFNIELFALQKEDMNPTIVNKEGKKLVGVEYTPDNTVILTFEEPVVIETAVDQEMILVPLDSAEPVMDLKL